MQSIKVLALDLDGTLLNGAKDVSRYSRNIIAQLHHQGVRVGLCSGRDLKQMENLLPVWQMQGIASFLIGNNGADYKNLETDQVIQDAFLSKEDLARLQKALHRYPVSIGVLYKNKFYWSQLSTWALMECLRQRKLPARGFADLPDEPFPRIFIAGAAKVIASVFARSTRLNLPLKFIPGGKHLLEVSSPEVSKYQALRHAMDDFGFSADEVMSFGDDYSDLELLRRTQGVAMKNGVHILKEASSQTTKYANAQDGVAYHLNTLLLSDYPFYEKDLPVQEEPIDDIAAYLSRTGALPVADDAEASKATQSLHSLNSFAGKFARRMSRSGKG